MKISNRYEMSEKDRGIFKETYDALQEERELLKKLNRSIANKERKLERLKIPKRPQIRRKVNPDKLKLNEFHNFFCADKLEWREYLTESYCDGDNLISTDTHRLIVTDVRGKGFVKDGYYIPTLDGFVKSEMDAQYPNYKRVLWSDKWDDLEPIIDFQLEYMETLVKVTHEGEQITLNRQLTLDMLESDNFSLLRVEEDKIEGQFKHFDGFVSKIIIMGMR